MSIFRNALILGALLAVVTAGQASAHALGQSYIFLRIYDGAVEGRFEIPVKDLNAALDLDFRVDGSVTDDEVATYIDVIRPYVLERVSMAADGTPVEIRITGHDLATIPLSQYVRFEFELDPIVETPKTLEIEYGMIFDVDSDHRGLLVIEHNWLTSTFNNESGVSLVFSPAARSQELDLTSSSIWRGFAGLFNLGVHHIWVGIDHILFLLALLLPSVVRRVDGQWTVVGDFRGALIRVIKIVTLFTLAHSITLSLAALDVVQVPSRLVESIIAVSIAIAAVDILFPVFHGRIWVVVFAFGLFHGFGFASVLGEMGISRKFMVLSLLGFNLGVEAGQAVIVCLAFPILYLLRSMKGYVRYVMPASAALLIVVSLYWFTERAFNVDLPAGAIAKRFMDLFA